MKNGFGCLSPLKKKKSKIDSVSFWRENNIRKLTHYQQLELLVENLVYQNYKTNKQLGCI
jgi:hypothetical protein